jgi:hypothetical protein
MEGHGVVVDVVAAPGFGVTVTHGGVVVGVTVMHGGVVVIVRAGVVVAVIHGVVVTVGQGVVVIVRRGVVVTVGQGVVRFVVVVVGSHGDPGGAGGFNHERLGDESHAAAFGALVVAAAAVDAARGFQNASHFGVVHGGGVVVAVEHGTMTFMVVATAFT